MIYKSFIGQFIGGWLEFQEFWSVKIAEKSGCPYWEDTFRFVKPSRNVNWVIQILANYPTHQLISYIFEVAHHCLIKDSPEASGVLL